jgi:hypothetical protein
MSEVSIDELERAMTVLKMRASEQQLLLKEAGATPAADAVRESLQTLLDKIYRMSAVRDAMCVVEPCGYLH